MMSGFDGSSASDPIASVGWLSVSGVHVVPPSVVFHTPPCAPAAYTVVELRGSTTKAETRPDVTPAELPFAPYGPAKVHCKLCDLAMVARRKTTAVLSLRVSPRRRRVYYDAIPPPTARAHGRI